MAVENDSYASSFMLWFEKDHDVMPATAFLQKYGMPLCAGLSLGYMIAIYAGQYAMKNVPRKEMRLALICWNSICALFAMYGSLRMVPELLSTLYNHGFQHSVCVSDYPFKDATGLWTELFMWSKAVELFDTAFLVLRKRPIIFLHWYHHVTVMMYTWHACKGIMGFNRLPKFIPMTLTSLQLSQMIVGCYISASVFWLKNSGHECHQSYENLYFCFLIYFTYGILFAKFFIDTYILSKPAAAHLSVPAMGKKLE